MKFPQRGGHWRGRFDGSGRVPLSSVARLDIDKQGALEQSSTRQ